MVDKLLAWSAIVAGSIDFINKEVVSGGTVQQRRSKMFNNNWYNTPALEDITADQERLIKSLRTQLRHKIREVQAARNKEEDAKVLVKDAYDEGVVDGIHSGYNCWDETVVKEELEEL